MYKETASIVQMSKEEKLHETVANFRMERVESFCMCCSKVYISLALATALSLPLPFLRISLFNFCGLDVSGILSYNTNL